MANELTDKAKSNIGGILRQNSYEKAKDNGYKPISEQKPDPACGTCKELGGNGMLKVNTVYMPCPTCKTII